LKWLAFTGLLALVLGLNQVAGADSGVGISLGSINVDDDLKPGGRYALPEVTVINTGDSREEYQLAITYIEDYPAKRPAPDWVEFQPQRFVLDSGDAQPVVVRVTVPSGAEPGDYFALIEAQMVGDANESVQASVATKLRFAVAEGSWLDAKRRQINRWLDDAAPWPYIAAGGLLMGIALRVSSRRLKFRLPFEPR
jgi:hypothetical protein